MPESGVAMTVGDSKNMWCEHYSQLISGKGCAKRQGRITSSRSGRFVDYYCHDQCKGSALLPATESQLRDRKDLMRRAGKEYGCELSGQIYG